MIAKAPAFEAMRVLHNLWSTNLITTVEVVTILKKQYDLELTAMTNSEIVAQSPDTNQKYSLSK